MNFVNALRDNIPSGGRLYSILAIVVIVMALLGNILFVRSSILPQWELRSTLASQLATAEQQLRDAERAQEEGPDGFREQLVAAQSKLEESANLFFSESQAAEVLNHLYQYASESGVEILSMENQPSPAEEEKEIYDAKTFQLQVAGAVPDLIGFMSRIKEATYKSFEIRNVDITEGEKQHNLTMDITLYTSSYSSGATGETSSGIIPTVTPVNLAQLEESLETAWAAADWDQAIYIVNQILSLDPDYDDMTDKLYTAHVNYGYQLWAEGNSGEAIAQFNLALEIKPGGDKALAGLQQAAATPTPTLTVQEQLEQDLDDAWTAADWEEAVSLIEQMLEINPNDPDMSEKLYAAYVNHGYQLAAQGELEEAKEAFSLALIIKPDGEEAKTGLQQLAGGVMPPTPIPEPQYTIHVVQQGENLFRIALRYGTTVDVIMAANELPNNNIYVGQQLRIPIP